jgi:hypothetical protein
MKPKKLPELSLLEKLFTYDKDTGIVTRKVSVSRNTKEGDLVGSKSDVGYLKVAVNGKSYPLSRICYKMHTKKEPLGEIDHINRNRVDNRASNLRDVSSQVNQLNRGARGYTVLKNGRYRVVLHNKDVGYFNCPTAATLAYLKAKGDFIARLK